MEEYALLIEWDQLVSWVSTGSTKNVKAGVHDGTFLQTNVLELMTRLRLLPHSPKNRMLFCTELELRYQLANRLKSFLLTSRCGHFIAFIICGLKTFVDFVN